MLFYLFIVVVLILSRSQALHYACYFLECRYVKYFCYVFETPMMREWKHNDRNVLATFQSIAFNFFIQNQVSGTWDIQYSPLTMHYLYSLGQVCTWSLPSWVVILKLKSKYILRNNIIAVTCIPRKIDATLRRSIPDPSLAVNFPETTSLINY